MKRKVVTAFITGMIALTGLQMTDPVYAEEAEDPAVQLSIESSMEGTEAEVQEDMSTVADDISVEEVLENEKSDANDFQSPEEQEEMNEETANAGLYGTDDADSTVQEDAQEGELSVSYDNDSLTSIDPDETFYVSYTGDAVSADEPTEPSALQITLDKGFTVTDIATGKWSGSDGTLTIQLYDIEGNNIGSMTVFQESSVDCTGFNGISDIVFETDTYSDSVTGIRIKGKADKETVSDPLIVSAVYESADGKKTYGEGTAEVSTTYLDLDLPEISISSSDLYLNDSGTLVINDFAGNREIDEMELRFTVPDGISLSSITLPEFADAVVTALLDGEPVEDASSISSLNGRKVSVRVKSENGQIRQNSSLSLIFFNCSDTEATADLQATAVFLFSDGTEKELSLKDIKLNLLGAFVPSADEEPVQETVDDSLQPQESEEKDTEESIDTGKQDKVSEEKVKEKIIQVINPAGIPLAVAEISIDEEPFLYRLFNEEPEEEYSSGKSIVTEEVKDASEVLKGTDSDENLNTDDEKEQAGSASSSTLQRENTGNIYRRNVLFAAALLIAGFALVRFLICVPGIIRRKKADRKEETN